MATLPALVELAESAAERLDADNALLVKASELVREFIAERQLVVYGGLAIDYALRLKGARLYPDAKLPDYDVFSAKAVDDARDLADRLYARGLGEAVAHPGMHVQTMSVRVQFRKIADLTVASQAALAAIPTLEYRGIRFVHPDYQRVDIHCALSFPYIGAPRPVISHRWRKDVTRFNRLAALYPVNPGELAGGSRSEREPRTVPLALVRATGDEEARIGARAALHGYMALAAFKGEATIEDRGGAKVVVCPVPSGAPAALASPEADELALQHAPSARWTYPFLDVQPAVARTKDLEIYATTGRLLAATEIKIDGERVAVVSPQYALLYFLLGAHLSEEPRRRELTGAYCELLALVADAKIASPLALSARVLGSANQSAAYIVSLARAVKTLKHEPPSSLELPPARDMLHYLAGLPDPYYPSTSKRKPFDHDACPLYLRDARPAVRMSRALLRASGK